MSVPPRIKPAGVGELKVVKQRVARYEPGEVAHVENVMASEERERKHRRLRQTEERLVEEVDRSEENVRDLQSAERFELETEAKSTIKEESSFEAGVDVSAGYGPFVNVTAYAKTASHTSVEEADRNATKYAKELTDRSLSRVEERVRRERETRTLDEIEELNRHAFTASAEHNVGVYRWVDKYQRLRVVPCGKRLWYEFVIPEPAAFFIYAQAQYRQHNVLPTEPEEPTVSVMSANYPFFYPEFEQTALEPELLTRHNYLGLLRRYRVEGVKPPPPEEIVVTQTISREFEFTGGHAFSISSRDLELPPGYKAAFGSCRITLAGLNASPSLTVLCDGSELTPSIRRDLMTVDGGSGDDYEPGYVVALSAAERDVVPISMSGLSITDGKIALSAHVTVKAEVTDEALERWRIETFNAVMNAYRAQLMEYEERLAAAEIQEGVRIEGRNPGVNREIERQELQKACLQSWLERTSLGRPGIVETGSPGRPEIDYAAAISNAEQVRFLEDSFEWENMSYELLPYFWGRSDRWVDDLAIGAIDPVFGQFLKAGGARVRVPVSLASTEAVLWYQLTGEIWSGGPVPSLATVDHPDAETYQTYLDDLADYIRDATERDGTPVPDAADPVEIDASDPTTFLAKIPTSLVWLQQDEHGLPDFEA